MVKQLILFCAILSSYGVLQAQKYTWKLEKTYLISSIEAWDVTPLQEVIASHNGLIFKLDSSFQQSFTQSRKEFGNIAKIDARHSLKTLLFSENQQMIGFVDNTLTFQDNKIDLASLNIGYGTHACYSNQTNRFWVYDEQNSRLVRFEGVQSIVAQTEITNLMNITRSSYLIDMFEKQNQLYLLYENGGVFVFDYYGSLLRKFSFKNIKMAFPIKEFLYVLTENELIRLNRETNIDERITLPKSGIQEIRVLGESIYLKDKDGISKYSLIPQP